MLKNLVLKVVNRFRNQNKEDYQLVKLENEQSSNFISNADFHKAIESSLKNVISQGGKFGGWALSESSLRYFCFYILSNNSIIKLIELGGGQSTFFWNNLIKSDSLKNYELIVHTFEHDKTWADKLTKRTGNIKIKFCPLKQLTDEEFNIIINDSINLATNWALFGNKVPKNEEKNTRLKNAFYDIPLSEIPEENSIDGLIIDGPHGNGRSIAFPLFYKALKLNSFILIDDYDHYPFIEDLGKLFSFQILQKSQTKVKKWILVQITEKK